MIHRFANWLATRVPYWLMVIAFVLGVIAVAVSANAWMATHNRIDLRVQQSRVERLEEQVEEQLRLIQTADQRLRAAGEKPVGPPTAFTFTFNVDTTQYVVVCKLSDCVTKEVE